MTTKIKKDASDAYNDAVVKAERTYIKHTEEAWARAMATYKQEVSLEELVYRHDVTEAEKEYQKALKENKE